MRCVDETSATKTVFPPDKTAGGSCRQKQAKPAEAQPDDLAQQRQLALDAARMGGGTTTQ